MLNAARFQPKKRRIQPKKSFLKRRDRTAAAVSSRARVSKGSELLRGTATVVPRRRPDAQVSRAAGEAQPRVGTPYLAGLCAAPRRVSATAALSALVGRDALRSLRPALCPG